MRNYFEEMNIDYDELKRYEDIETYYDEVQDYSKLIQELQCDRVEVLKQIVNKNKEIERLNNIIEEVREIFKDYGDKEDIVGYTMYNITGEQLINILDIVNKALGSDKK